MHYNITLTSKCEKLLFDNYNEMLNYSHELEGVEDLVESFSKI